MLPVLPAMTLMGETVIVPDPLLAPKVWTRKASATTVSVVSIFDCIPAYPAPVMLLSVTLVSKVPSKYAERVEPCTRKPMVWFALPFATEALEPIWVAVGFFFQICSEPLEPLG